jgi:di/tricarboxylate transporter
VILGLTLQQAITLGVLAAVVAALIWDKVRSDVVALTGAAVLLLTGAVLPLDVQRAFASPALIALASLFVIAYAMELSGLLDLIIRGAVKLCRWIGAAGLWIVILLSGAASAFLNNTPIVVLGAPVVRDAAESMGLSSQRFLIPLSYIAILGGCVTLIGTSTNLLVNDMAIASGLREFGMFEMTPGGACRSRQRGRLPDAGGPAPAARPRRPQPGSGRDRGRRRGPPPRPQQQPRRRRGVRPRAALQAALRARPPWSSSWPWSPPRRWTSRPSPRPPSRAPCCSS